MQERNKNHNRGPRKRLSPKNADAFDCAIFFLFIWLTVFAPVVSGRRFSSTVVFLRLLPLFYAMLFSVESLEGVMLHPQEASTSRQRLLNHAKSPKIHATFNSPSLSPNFQFRRGFRVPFPANSSKTFVASTSCWCLSNSGNVL